jgi:NhaP-type Na+/H+ or K+/H+ antiporter
MAQEDRDPALYFVMVFLLGVVVGLLVGIVGTYFLVFSPMFGP